MSLSTRNAILHSTQHPVDVGNTRIRQLFNPSQLDPTAEPNPTPRPTPDGEVPPTSLRAAIPPMSSPGRRRSDLAPRVVKRRRSQMPLRREDIRELIKAAAIVGALIVALNVYAAIVSASAL